MAVLTERFILREPVAGDYACLQERGLSMDAELARRSSAFGEDSRSVSFIDRQSGAFAGHALFLGVPPLGSAPNRIWRKELHLYALDPADEAAMAPAALQWLEEGNVAYLIDLPDGTSMRLYHDAPAHVDALLRQALARAEGMEPLTLRHVSPHALHRSRQFIAHTPGECLWALCMTPMCSGLRLEAGFLYPHRTDDWWPYVRSWGIEGYDLKLRVIRHANTVAELNAFFAEADALKAAFLTADREAIKAESTARKKAFVKEMGVRARAIGLKGRVQNWQADAPDGSTIRLHTETTPYSDWYTIDVERHLSDPTLPPIQQVRQLHTPFGRDIDWQRLSGRDLDDLFRILDRDFLRPLIHNEGSSHESDH